MSDPMTNMQIEDVLSSIRRLVSEDHRPSFASPAKPQPVSGKLVLTPALRIVPVSDQKPETDDGAGPSRGEMFTSVRKAMSSERGPLVQPNFGFDTISHEAAAAVLEAALSRRADDWEPDGSEVASGAVDWTIEWDADGGFPDEADDVPVELGAADRQPKETLVDWQDDPDADHAMMDPSPRDEAFSVLEDDDDAIIDEETLREIVRDIIREELQGGLGERITRNVRKLVRAEINQALATRDFG